MRSGALVAHGSVLANSTFEGTFYFFQAPKMADIPHREEKNDLFCGIFPHFLNSPTISLTGDHVRISPKWARSRLYSMHWYALSAILNHHATGEAQWKQGF